jgi:hypothetical protein
MNFDKLFNQVFLTEQDEPVVPAEEVPATPAPETDGAPMPDSYDVEPAPITTPTGDAGTLKTHITKIEVFADYLIGVDSGSLQQLVTDIDRPGSLFQGISRETSRDIIRIAEQLTGLSEIIKGFVINSAKRSRDIAGGQG